MSRYEEREKVKQILYMFELCYAVYVDRYDHRIQKWFIEYEDNIMLIKMINNSLINILTYILSPKVMILDFIICTIHLILVILRFLFLLKKKIIFREI